MTLSAIGVLAVTSVVQAVPTLRITDGFTTVMVVDNLGGDTSPTAGFVNYSAPAGTFAGWSIIVSFATTKPAIGSATAPEVDLHWSATRLGSSAGTLTVCFSENGFNLTGPSSFVVATGGTLGNSAANSALVRTYYDGGDTVQATTALMTTHSFTGPGAFSANDSGSAPADPTVAFTVKVNLNQAAGELTSGEVHLYAIAVPDGGSMVTLCGVALFALGLFSFRRKIRV